MLIITRALRPTINRPKYRRQADHAQWCVRDTETASVVFGPATMHLCRAFMKQKEKENLNE